MLDFQAVPSNAGNRGHREAHLVEHLARMRVMPVKTQTLGHFHNDPQVLARVSRRR